MSVHTKSNLPQHEALRWNLRKASVELGTTSDTLKKRLNQISASPDSDGLFSTLQLVRALFGELHQEKIRTQRALAQKLELENAVTTGSFLNRSELLKGLAQIADAMVSRIMASELSRSAKEALLRDLSSIPLVLKDVAHAQSRLLNGKSEENQSDRKTRSRGRAKGKHGGSSPTESALAQVDEP